MAPRPVFPLPAVAFEVAVIGAATTTAQQKKMSTSAQLRNSLLAVLIGTLDEFFGV
ncbi:hypothetical protein SAMN05443247_05771 [Bradyrhizobium erythrophlei]|nr:hypothetical protein SAMN05443247_05771 [Bradyrhizobium erythrophlei]